MNKPTASVSLPGPVMVFGCGYVGTALACRLIAQGVRVGALTRNTERAAVLSQMGLSEVVVADLDGEGWMSGLAGSYESVVNCVSSAGGGLDGYRKSYVEGQKRILEWAAGQNVRTFVYTSSTSVYPQDHGSQVDEDADTSAAPPTGQVLLESEQLIQSHASLFNRWYVLRLAGIYGPERHFLLNQLRESTSKIPGRGDYHMNMVHRDDIVQALLISLNGLAPSGVYNICDDEPSTKESVLAYLAGQLNLPVPEFDPEIIPSRLQRRGGRMPDRLIVNRKARTELGWEPAYKSYREGYASILK